MSKSQNSLRRTAITMLVLVAATLSLAISLAAQPAAPEEGPIRFTAQGINMGSIGGGGGSKIFQFIIDRWSTEEERQALVQAFDQKGAKGLLAALQETKRLGTLRSSTAFEWDLRYAVQVPTEDGGRRIIVGTERRVNYWQTNGGTKTLEYPFTLVELHLDKDDKGEGRVSLATKITRSKDGKRIELENYSAEPVHLQDVHRQKD